MDNGGETLRKMIDQTGAGDTPILSQTVDVLNATLGKVARQVFDCDAALTVGATDQVSLKAMLESAPAPGLLVIVKAGGCKGILTLDGMLINGLVELMAGASDRAVYKQAREPTLIDIALCREFCDALLAEFPRKLAGQSGQIGICDLVWQEPETEASRLAVTFDNKPMARVAGKVDLQNGLRGGEISLSLPMKIWQGEGGQTTSVDDPNWTRELTKNVLAAPMPLRANLEKIELPLTQAMALKPGDLLEISAYALSGLELVTKQGTPLLKGRLGQENGKKAISIDGACETANGPMLNLKPSRGLDGAETKTPPQDETPVKTGPDAAQSAPTD